MHDLAELVGGYHRFVAARDKDDSRLYRKLADEGQAPETMVIGCCDSRVDPAAIFDAGPGELFVVRNVANLVPPFEPHGEYHGTSAAIEFAVTGLGITNIVVLGHARCGGVAAFLDRVHEPKVNPGFINRWMSLLNPARATVLKSGPAGTPEQHQQELELQGIRVSLANLQTFPFVKEAMTQGRLKLRGAYFSIFVRTLLGMDPDTGEFAPISS